MICCHVQVVVAIICTVTLAASGEELKENKRKARNPGLLHLVHAGESVGSYLDSTPRVSSLTGFGGGGGPHIVIVGGDGARVSTHVAGKDSLEEIEQELKQHYGTSPLTKYGPNSYSGYRGHHLLDHAGRTHLNFLGIKGRTYGHHIAAPPILGHHLPVHGHQPIGYKLVPLQHVLHGHHGVPHYSATPSPLSYASPVHSLSPTPLSHTIATPTQTYHGASHYQGGLGLPLHHAGAGQHLFLPVPQLQGGHYGVPLQHPSYPLQHPQAGIGGHGGGGSGGGHSQTQQRTSSESEARYNEDFFNNGHHSDLEDDSPGYYNDVQERNSGNKEMEHRDIESSSEEGTKGYKDTPDSFKSYKYESQERTAGKPDQSSLLSDFSSSGRANFDESSLETNSGEKSSLGNFKFKFSDDFGIKGRSFSGEPKVATSFQSVVIENHSVPLYLNKKP